MKYFFLVACLLVAQTVTANQTLETLQLKHRLADEMLPHIEAIVPSDTVVRPFGDKLIIKADKSTIANVVELLKQIDIAQQSLIISVLRTSTELIDRDSSQANVTVTVDEAIHSEVHLEKWSTKNSRNKDQTFKVRGISGSPVSINLGQDIPRQSYYVFSHPRGGTSIQQSTYYQTTDSGFKALAQLLPDHQVRVDIYPFFSEVEMNSGSKQQSELITTVTGNTGKWIELGLITDQANQTRNGSSTYSSYSSNQQFIYLKVDPQPN